MNKRRLHHVWKQLRWIRPWYFLVLAILSGVVCIYALRANNEHMVKLRAQLYAADQNSGDVQGALIKLQAYVTAHMNTDLSAGPNAVYPPVQLKYTYDRLIQAESDQVSQTNAQLYSAAQKICEQQDPVDFSGRNRVPCIDQYVQTHGVKLAPIPSELYKFDFISPAWSPDLAGWSLVATVLSFLVFAVTFIVRRWLKRTL